MPIKEENDFSKEFKLKEKTDNLSPSCPVIPEELPVRRKQNSEMTGTYDWTSHLKAPGFCAAPVSCFRHVSFIIIHVKFMLC